MPSKKELEAQSWEFLTTISDAVTKLSEFVNTEILKQGKRLNKAGVTYIHMINKYNNNKTSLAKTKTQEQLEK